MSAPPTAVDRRGAALVRHSPLHLRPDPARVLARLFLPGQEMATHGISRAEAVVLRVVALAPEEVTAALTQTMHLFADRHPHLERTLRDHFAHVAHRVPSDVTLSQERADLIGAYFTQELAIEGAALFNPSIVADPSQEGVPEGSLRFVMSVRAVGEGHLSTIGFRTGVVGPGDEVSVDPATGVLDAGMSSPLTMSLLALRRALATHGDARAAESVLSLLPDEFGPADLEDALVLSEREANGRRGSEHFLERVRELAASDYQLRFPADVPLSNRVMHPTSPAEANGMEDARFVTFTRPDGSVTHFATYTAYDGEDIAPHLIQTDDFRTFWVRQQTGEAATNKGMALFPRLVAGRYWAISRWDRENLSVARSDDALHWEGAATVQRPRHAWDLVQLGACASPVETPAGWLVITHGVGPMRTYALGAMLLDLDDPTRVLAVLDEPLMTVDPPDREGYVPNVVYTCGVLVHGPTVVMPYGCSDATIRFAFVDLAGLLARLADAPPLPETS